MEGFKEHYNLGVKLRNHYIDTLHFLPEEYDPSLIYVRSTSNNRNNEITTDSERTIQSAQAQLLGFYPPATRKGPNGETEVLDIFTMEGAKENM